MIIKGSYVFKVYLFERQREVCKETAIELPSPGLFSGFP